MYEDQLPITAFDVVKVSSSPKSIEIEIEARKVKLSDNPNATTSTPNAWRYIREDSKEDGRGTLEVALGPIINVQRGETLKVKWVNKLDSMPPLMAGDGPTLEMPPINAVPMEFPNFLWEKMNPSVGVVTHLHGAKVLPDSDGWPLLPASFQGNPYNLPTHRHYTYTNDQRAAMLWFHDHAMDNTSPQVHAGLAGIYFVRDESDTALFDLIGGANNEIPLVIQDRKFDCGFDHVNFWAGVPTENDPNDPAKKQFERPEFLGETIFVNGRPSPFAKVGRNIYRLRILNGSNARTYALALIDPWGWATMSAMNSSNPPRVWYSDLLTVIGNDGGLLPISHKIGNLDNILLAPGERLDLLLDLTSVDPMLVPRLRLANLAVASAQAGDWPEAIFQTTEALDFVGVASAPSSLINLDPAADENDRTLLGSLCTLGCANILEFCIEDMMQPADPLDQSAVDSILLTHANEDGFLWNGTAFDIDPANGPVVANRFIVLMNNTDPNATDPSPYTGEIWRDTQIWELMTTPGIYTPFKIPFSIDLTGANPVSGVPSSDVDYYVTRSAFFKTYPASKRIDQDFVYDDLNTNAITPKEGTYERWYVANLTNEQNPLKAGSGGDSKTPPTIPDMHPFHMHLVNFVVTNRWRLNSTTNIFEEKTGERVLDFDKKSRHDTTRVQSNELLELLVYFPPGYTGIYPFHCHIVEHEDMGMMSHFEVLSK